MESKELISAKSFTPEELRKWQLKLLEILVYFREFCQAHNLRFFLAAGTCIGAVRHHGFIKETPNLTPIHQVLMRVLLYT